MRALLLALLLLLAGLPARAQTPVPPPAPAEHLFFVDVSGSMDMQHGGFGSEESFSPEVEGWVRALFAPGGLYFRADDRVTFRPFSDEDTERKQNRAAVGPVPLSRASATFDALEGPHEGATDMERVLTELAGQRTAPVRFLWILTDNQNNLGAKTSDAEFYRLLRDQPQYDSVYFLPMARPAAGSGALVVYLLVEAQDPVEPWIDGFVDEVEKRLGFEAVLFRPLYTDLAKPVLQFGTDVKTANDKGSFTNAVSSGNRVIVNLYRKGNTLEGRLRFHLRSRMDGWAIKEARLTADLQSAGVEGDLTPNTLTVQPNRETEQQYVLVIRNRDPKPREMQADLLLQAEVRLSATGPSPNLEPFVSPTVRQLMNAVPQLNEILSLMQAQRDEADDSDELVRHITLHQPLLLRPHSPATRTVSWLPWLALPGLLLLALLAWALSGRTYLLDDRRIRLGGLFRQAALESRDGELLGHLQPAGREVRIVPVTDVRLDGQEGPREVKPDHGEVSFKLQGSRGATVFTLARPGAGGSASGSDEGLSL